MSETAELLERFRRGPELLAAALTGAAGPELDYVPEPGKWSIRQIAAHLADAEMMGAGRMRQIIAEENPTLMAWQQDSWAEKLDYSRRKPSESLDTFRHIRALNYELLKPLTDEAFARGGTHSERGPITLLDTLRIYAQHAEKHAQQIMGLRAQYKQFKAAGGKA